MAVSCSSIAACSPHAPSARGLPNIPSSYPFVSENWTGGAESDQFPVGSWRRTQSPLKPLHRRCQEGSRAMYFPGMKAFVQGEILMLDGEVPAANPKFPLMG